MDVLHTGEANYDRFLVKSKQLVCGTLVGMGLRRIEIENAQFDWVIVDEAGRAQASELMIALQSAKRILLVGDQKQLPPYYEKAHLKQVANKMKLPYSAFAESDFSRAYNVNAGVRLDTQYRMVKPIGDIVSECFYADGSGRLETGRGPSPSWYNDLPVPWNLPVTWIDSHCHGEGDGEEEQQKGKYINRNELTLICTILKLLNNTETLRNLEISITKEQPYPIGIITMYRAQKDLIENEISKSEWAAAIRRLVKIDTVDSYQGQENKIIILSLVRDNGNSIQGFLGDAPRINVSISRAQERLVILGAKRMWCPNNNDSALGNVFDFISKKAANQTDGYQLLNIADFGQGDKNEQ